MKPKKIPSQEILSSFPEIISKNKEKWSDDEFSKNQLEFINEKDGISIISDLFRGMFKSQIKCNFCQKTSKNLDIFTICSLPIPKKSIKTLKNCYFQRKSGEIYNLSCFYEKQKNHTIRDLKIAIIKKFNLKNNNTDMLIARNVDLMKEKASFKDDVILEVIRKPFTPKILFRELTDLESNIPEPNRVPILLNLKTIGDYSKRPTSIREIKSFQFFDKTTSLEYFHFIIYSFLMQQMIFAEGAISFDDVREIGEVLLPYTIKVSKEHDTFFFDDQNENVLSCTVSETLEQFMAENKKKDLILSLDIHFKSIPTLNKIREENLNLTEEKEISNYVKKNGLCTIFDCLNLMTMEEKLDEANKWFCPVCNKNQLSTKKLEIYETSPILVFHFKRNQQIPKKKKINTKINFPIKNLDISQYIISGENNRIYDLFAICNHYGEVNQGHYTAMCWNEFNGKWFEFNDEKVILIENLDDLISVGAYILFYKRR